MRLVALLILSLLAFTPAQAAGPEPYDAEAMLARIYAGEVGTVEAHYARMQAQFLAGEIDADAVRRAYMIFDTTHPDTIAFVEDWRAAYPASPHALAARAWVKTAAGQIMRGSKRVRETYPQAMEEQHWLHAAALDSALAALEIEPRLIAASDAVLVLANVTGTRHSALGLLDRVMAQDPNWGSLWRGLVATSKQWGGSTALGEDLCLRHGEKLPKGGTDGVKYCLASLYYYVAPDRRAAVPGLLAELDDPGLDWIRRGMAMSTRDVSPQDAEMLRAYFEGEETRDLDGVRTYDRYTASRYGFEPQEQAVAARAKAHARTWLRHSPYAPGLIGTLLQKVPRPLDTTGASRRYTMEDGLEDDERMQLLWDRLVFAPYEPDYWQDIATEIWSAASGPDEQVALFLAADPMMINAIAYSNHHPKHLANYVSRKLSQYVQLVYHAEAGWPEPFDRLAPVLEDDAQLLCPMLRAAWIYDEVAPRHRNRGYSLSEETVAQVQALRLEVTAAGRCSDTLKPGAGVFFEPVGAARRGS